MKKQACIIGAGSSGIAAVKALSDRGITFDCFEASDRVGGLWAFRGKDGKTAAYKSLHINTSRDRMAYADFPMPTDYPDFPHHTQIAAYFDAYVDRFRLRPRITFGTRVEHADPLDGGGYRVRLSTGERRDYGFIVVANGHHWDAQWPDPPYPGTFDGTQMHSHEYVDPQDPVDMIGRRVLVVGFGNSAMDIASELGSRVHAERVFLSTRRGGWVVPKYLFGRPLDATPMPVWIPFAARRWIYERALLLAVGRMERYGLPTPDHRVASAHPTVSSEILDRIVAGDVVVKPGLTELAGKRVLFSDGSEERIDVIVWCTGYRLSFPFFDRSVFEARDNAVELFFNVFSSKRPDIAFVGLVQPLGAIMPISELQSKVIASHLAGEYTLPPRAEMDAKTRRHNDRMRTRYVASRRHTIQVDFDDYMHALSREWSRGKLRPRASSSIAHG